MHAFRALLLLLGLTVLGSPSAAQTTEVASSADVGGVLRPGDQIRLAIWREPDLSGDFQVNESGEVVFPKIGSVQVTSLSPDSLKRTLLAAYSTYLRNPSIEITLLRRVQVLGAVRSPGLYPVDPTMTLADVLAKAGGATPQGNTKKFELRRGAERITTTVTADTRVADTPLRSGDQLFIPERSWFSRNTWVFAGVLSAATTIFVATMAR
jgi:protein involved in polysaccharide export with SLBB domain